jgi:hypothetical protein
MPDDELEDENLPYEEATALIFGTDPCEWAWNLFNSLRARAVQLESARQSYKDAEAGLSGADTERASHAVREAVLLYLAILLERLQSLPAFQREHRILEQLRLTITDLADLDGGREVPWLKTATGKKRLSRNQLIEERIRIIAALEILTLRGNEMTATNAAEWLAGKLGIPRGTILDWRRSLYLKPAPKYFTAQSLVRTEIGNAKAILTIANAEEKRRIIQKIVSQLIGVVDNTPN